MRPQLLLLPEESLHSFHTRRDMRPNVNSRWHYHPDYELIFIHQGNGKQLVGNSIKRFEAGSIILIGGNLPHCLVFDQDAETRAIDKQPFSTVVHFKENFWSEQFLNLPENSMIRDILVRGRAGIELASERFPEAGKLIEQLAISEGPRRITLLIEILTGIARTDGWSNLSTSLSEQPDSGDELRLNKVYEFTLLNFKSTITLEQMADLLCMQPSSFCRYFKSRTGKRYKDFLAEIRIDHACKLLVENRMQVKDICYECGFHNGSSFHKAFKTVTGTSPLSYQQEFLAVALAS